MNDPVQVTRPLREVLAYREGAYAAALWMHHEAAQRGTLLDGEKFRAWLEAHMPEPPVDI